MRRAWIAVVLLGIAMPASAYELAPKPFDLAVSAGVLGSGNVDAAWYDDFKPSETISFTNNPSLLTRLMADFYITPNFSLGAAFNYAAIVPAKDIDYYDNGWHHIGKNDIAILDYCLGIKGRFLLSETVAVKPGIYFGGRSSFSSVPEAREFGMAINGSLEIQVFLHENYFAFVDTGFLTQPYGGVRDVAFVRGGPIFYFNLGLGL